MTTKGRAVWVTGIGAVSPLGHSWPETWGSLLGGASGVDEITLFDASSLPVRIAAEVKEWDPAILARRDVRHLDRSVQFALAAAREAVAHAGSSITDPDRVGVVVASATGGLATIDTQMRNLMGGGYRRVSPHLLPNMLADSAPAHIAMEIGATGPNMAVVSACATGSNTIGEAAAMIGRGDADVMLAGGTEACIVPLFMAGFCQMRALATPDERGPAAAARPFDRGRSGLVVGEGAAILVLEAAEHAAERGRTPLAEVIGYGTSCDAHHMAHPDPEAHGMSEAMERALRGINKADIDYISAHGTATPQNDRLETTAIKAVLGDHARAIPISSIKGATGHPMAASGALEAAVCVQVLQDGTVPPTINLEDPDPECDLDYVPKVARNVDVRVALSNSFGMGGHNASLVFRRT